MFGIFLGVGGFFAILWERAQGRRKEEEARRNQVKSA
jgi:hypothetical protein